MAQGLADGFSGLFILSFIGQEESPAVCPCNGQALALPLIRRPVEAEKIIHSLFLGEGLFPIRTIEIDQVHLAVHHHEIFELQVSMKKTCIVKLSEHQTCIAKDLPLERQRLTIGKGAGFAEVFDEVPGLWKLAGQEVGAVEERENRLVDGADGTNRRDSAGADFLGQSQFAKRSRTEPIEVSRQKAQKSPVRIVTHDHPFLVSDRDGEMGSSPAYGSRSLLMS